MSDFSNTVMPKEDSESKQHSQGLPGIHLPKDADNIKEFSERSNVDPKELNARIEKAEADAKAKLDELSK